MHQVFPIGLKLMSAKTSLQLRILRLVGGMLLLVSVTISVAVWYSTDSHLREQIGNDLTVANSVLTNTLMEREKQLVQAAQVLTADFGFKQAVASGDTQTINSALANQGERINADLMALLSLEGVITASSVAALPAGQGFPSPTLLKQAIELGGVSAFLRLDNAIFQLILLPVTAPDIIGVAAIGFRVNPVLVKTLRDVTQQDITFVYDQPAVSPLTVSSLPPAQLQAVLANPIETIPFRMPFAKNGIYVTRTLTLSESDEQRIRVLISASVDAAYSEFDHLKFEIFVISVLAILLSLLGGSIFASNISLPLRRLADAARGLADSDYQQTVDAGKSSQEVHDLNAAFRTMQADLKDREERITFQSSHDPLTGLLNRARLLALMSCALQKNSEQRWLALAINVRDFRVVNETFGYAAGDACLNQIAERLVQAGDEASLCARLAGDEFLVFVPLLHAVTDILARYREILQPSCKDKGLDIPLQFSFATAQYPRDALTASDLLNRADVALDISRRQKREVFHYEAGIEQARLQRLQLINDLKTAISADDGQLRMYYQPKVSLRDGAPSRFEALIRWIHPVQSFIPPDHFIPLAEQTGLINLLTDWVVSAVIKQLAVWHQSGLQLTVAVNLSAQDVGRSQLLENIITQIEANQLPRASLSVEITESDIMNEPEKAIAQLECYRANGFSVAIDDFGTGYSSLSQLKNMPVSELKIDKSFILQLDKNENDQIIVRSTLELAHRFNLEVVAEGVENQAALALLSQWGCEWIQGYYFSKPLPAADVRKWVDDYWQSPKVISIR